MKNISKTCLATLFILIISTYSSLALGPLKIGFAGGISLPDGEINNVLNENKQYDWSSDGNGYNLGLNFRFDIPLTDWGLQGGIAYHNFPLNTAIYTNDKGGTRSFEINKSIIAFSAGVNYELYSIAKIVDFYIGTAPTYNYMIYTAKLFGTGINIPLIDDKQSVSDGRVGLNFSTGIDVNAVVFTGNIEAKYSIINLIGSDDGEELKSFFAISLGIYF